MKTVAFFLLLVSSSLTRSTELTVNVTSNIQNVKIDTKVFKIVLDESSASSDGVLFVGARNQILKINASTLTLVDSKRESSLLQNNDYTVIAIHNTSHIITCGTSNYGMCSMREKDDLSKFSLIGDPHLAQNHVVSKKSTLFFPIKTSPADSSNSYVIGHEYDDRPENILPPTLSVRRIESSPNLSFDYLHDGSKRSAINMFKERNKVFLTEYIFGFYDERFFYIISNHYVKGFLPRIARACLTDATMTTFAELGFYGVRPIILPTLNTNEVVTTAHYGPITTSGSSNITNQLQIILTETRDPNETSDSYIISIGTDDLEAYFGYIVDECMRQTVTAWGTIQQREELEEKGPRADLKSPACYMNWTNNHCEPRSTNFYPEPLGLYFWQSSKILYNKRITSFATYVSNNCVIVLIGTYTGEIIKMRWVDPWIELFRYDFTFSSDQSADRQVQPNPVIDGKQNYAYFAVSNHIIKFPLQSCSIYTRCSDCITVSDPLGCGWCGDKCASKNECDATLSDICLPMIENFDPKTGPTGGGTKITILGDNFGTRSNNWKVHINGLLPLRNLDIREDKKIVCTTIASKPKKVKITLDFIDTNRQEYGVESEPYFSFLEFNVTGITPSFSTKVGGSLFKITGRNLHIGGTRSVQIILSSKRPLIMANCTIREVSENEIQCMMGPCLVNPLQNWNLTIGYLSVTIDGDQKHTDIPFEFKDNPVVTDISPSEIEPSSSVNITVTGRNLDSIALPVLNILNAIDHHKNITVPCKIINSKRLNCELRSLDAFWTGNYATMHLGDHATSINYSRKYPIHLRSSVLIQVLIMLSMIISLSAAVAYCCLRRCCVKWCCPSKKEYAAVGFTSDHHANMSPDPEDFYGTDLRTLDSDKEYLELISQLQASKKFITREYLTHGQLIGEGYFSSVHKGTLEEPEGESKEVAIKTLKDTSCSEVKAFLREAVNMKDLGHENVLSLIGVAFSAGANVPELVLPFMSNGDVLSYVRDENNEPTVRQLLTFTLDIAKGMEYLSDQRIVHRDLAARNCILDDDFVARVSDFGLSRDVYEKNYYCSDKRAPLPYKWMAIESIQKGTFTSKSDVWSYGVTSWEVMTRGQLPYPGVENSELKDHLLSRNRLQIPLFCPQLVYNLWTRCWLSDADERPTFGQIIDEIEDLFMQNAERSPEEKVADSSYENIAHGKYYNGTGDINNLRRIVPIGNCYS